LYHKNVPTAHKTPIVRTPKILYITGLGTPKILSNITGLSSDCEDMGRQESPPSAVTFS
jgi:hypothetical protein